MENGDVIGPSPHINFPLKKKSHFCEVFPSSLTPHHQKSSDCRPDTSTTSNCKSNLWKAEWVFSSSFVVYHTCFFLISKDTTIAVLVRKINTFPPHLFPKVSFLHCCSLSTHLVRLGWLWLKSMLVLMSEWCGTCKKKRVFTYDYQVPVFGKIMSLFPYI